jgi:hypothetical protein
MLNTDLSAPSRSINIWSGKERWLRPAAVMTAFLIFMGNLHVESDLLLFWRCSLTYYTCQSAIGVLAILSSSPSSPMRTKALDKCKLLLAIDNPLE